MKIHPSHFECIKSTILTGLGQMYIDSSCSNLGIAIKISNVSFNPAIIDPNEGLCLVKSNFLPQHIIPNIWDNLKKKQKKNKQTSQGIFHVLSFDNTEEKAAVRCEGEKFQEAICEITLCQYLGLENELPIDPNIRFLCVTYPV